MQATKPALNNQPMGCVVEDFSLPLLSGGQHSLSTALAGKKGALVVFWSAICSHCARYDKYLLRFQDRHPDLGILLVACRQGEVLGQVRRVVADRRLTIPMVYDAGSALAAKWFTQYTPKAFLLDQDRRLLYRGAIDNFRLADDPVYVEYLEPAIEDFRAGRPVRQPETATFGCAIQSVYYQIPNAL